MAISVRPSLRGRVRNLANTMGTHIPFCDRISCTIPHACAATGIGRTKLYEALSDGRLKSVKVDNRRLVLVESLLRLLEVQRPSAVVRE